MASTVWAHVLDGVCDNIIMLDPETSNGYPMDGLTEIDGFDPMPGIGWKFNGVMWTAPPVPTLTGDPSVITGTETSTVTYTWQGWPEDTPPASVDFIVNGGAPQSVDVTNDTASITVSASDAVNGQIVVQCAGLTTSIIVQ